jgi:hypothetical protein
LYDLAVHLPARKMDPRVKPAGDATGNRVTPQETQTASSRELDPEIHLLAKK